MEIGIIGAGTVAQAFAGKAIDAGHLVAFSNSRGPQSLTSIVGKFGPSASAVTRAKAAERLVVLLAVPWPRLHAALEDLPAWNGRILIDATNAFIDGTPKQGIADFADGTSSEYVASLAPGARVVKAMNSLFMTNFVSEASTSSYRRVAFVSADDRVARRTVADLFESLGFAPVDLGGLATGGRIQAVGGPIAGHDFFLPWPAARTFPAFNGQVADSSARPGTTTDITGAIR
ncbi:NADP oxidoreductase [Sphingomonas sp. UV9]|uniref:NADPH-dependent F420 reductase n=1 Tax=Sphingomonas sp. UV9 TaxID=1851410 RepID=UPI000FFC0A67|nr:NAD(P)-binding domain-containing protein [Sphingomonas sp. UV9]RXD04770.1 NADP oxidoreductase [Sphingomonas sp. UV9]